MKKTCRLAAIIFLFLVSLSLVYLIFIKPSGNLNQANSDYRFTLRTTTENYHAPEGRRINISLTIFNTGKKSWISEEGHPYALSYHLLDAEGNMVRFENRRYSLPSKVLTGEEINRTVTIRVPLRKGRYWLEFDILQEGIFWFKDQGSKTFRLALHVEKNDWPDFRSQDLLEYGPFTFFSSEIEELNSLYKLIRLTLEQNEKEFNGRTGTVCGFSAGTSYPQIWLRDANTIIPASKYFYKQEFLTSWLEEHLAFQNGDGSLFDWFDSEGKTDKNTTETDQEASAIQSAFQIFQILGPDWLKKEINGLAVIKRLDKALSYVDKNCRHKKIGLLTGAHTADWGDVDMVDADQQAVYVDEKTHWTADIYDQSMFFQASLELSRMLEVLGQKERSLYWKKNASALRTRAIEQLWMENRGYFRVHTHLDDLIHIFNEDDMFAMGGNALAVVSGLADKNSAARIIREACSRQKNAGLSTISGTLYPPYPKNFFRHPMMDDPYEYQNGAQWDWFGGRMIQAMFENGFSRTARTKLLEIARKNIANGGFFEWDNKEGVGLGSDYFTGSAGILGKAVIEGYFGIKATRESLEISPKLGRNSGKIHIYLPAIDRFAAYEYRYDPEENKVFLSFNSNYPKKGMIKVLYPQKDEKMLTKIQKDSIQVKQDGEKVDFWLNRKAEDVFIVFESDCSNRKIEILLNKFNRLP
jgi:hypothetical protein